METRREVLLSERFHTISRKGRNAKPLCDSGISTPCGDPAFSSLFSATGCRGVSGHEIGFDFTRMDIPFNVDTQRKLEEFFKRNFAGHVGMVTFNQAYDNSPASVVCCTSCNRTDFFDRASNMGLCTAYEMPVESMGKNTLVPKTSRKKQSFWREEEEEEIHALETASPVRSRNFVSKDREHGSKELDAREIGDPMCINGCSFGITYVGSQKLDGLTSILSEPADPTKTRTVRFSVAKLLRRSLPRLLDQRYGPGTWIPSLHNKVFCSFKRTRTNLFIWKNYLIRRIEEHLRRFCRVEGGGGGGGGKETTFSEETPSDGYIHDRVDQDLTRRILKYVSSQCVGEEGEREGLEGWRYGEGKCESFQHFKGGESFEEDPSEWRGPWYRSTQSMDEDELSFFNLDFRYLVEIHGWLRRGEEEEEEKEYSVVTTLLLRLYVSNDVMHALSPTRDRMLRLLLQLFVDQMLDLYSFLTSEGVLTDEVLMLSEAERQEYNRLDEREEEEGGGRNMGPIWWKWRNEGFCHTWKRKVNSDPESLVRTYDKLYPHGRRFFSATELPDLTHLFPYADIWNKYRPMSDYVAWLINHIFLCKTQAHRCLIRSIATVLDQHKNESSSLIQLIMDILAVHLLGNYTGATHRPCLRSRALIRSQLMELVSRTHDDIIEWIDQNQHMVYIAFREFMHDQMARTGSLRGLLLETSWQMENEMYCKFACDMTRVVISDRFRFPPFRLGDLLISDVQEMYRAKDIVPTGEGKDKRWCIRPPETRDMMIPHLMRGYRKRLHQLKFSDEEADAVVSSMTNQDIYAVIDAMNEEMLTECRRFQTKLSKGHFWERVHTDMGKFIAVECPYVLDLSVQETLERIEENQSSFATRKDPTGIKGMEEAKKKLVQSMIAEISSYRSDMFSVTESDGILTGNHIRTIKLVAKYAARTVYKKNHIDFSWLVPLGVSYGTIAYLNFLFYAYQYHGLPDNRLKMDMPFILNRKHTKVNILDVEELSKLSKYKQRKYAEEFYRTEGCYDMGIPYEPWMDECAIRWNEGEEEEEKENETFFDISSVDVDGRPLQLSEEEKDEDREKVYRKRLEQFCHLPEQMGFYDGDDVDYEHSDIPIDASLRKDRTNRVLGRDPTVGERDIAILCIYLHFYQHATFMQTVPLPKEIGRHQVRALKSRMGLCEGDPTPKDIGIMRYCGCGEWTESLVSSPEKISTIYAKGEYGAAYDLISGIKRCQKAKTRFCGRKLNEIDMIAKAVRMGKSWYVLCVVCGILTLWRRESYSDLGPTCGCHACPMRPATRYPMTLLALSEKDDIQLHRSLVNEGMIMTGYIHCAYCKEYIIPGKAVPVRVWNDDDERVRPSPEGHTIDTEGPTPDWEEREEHFQRRYEEACDAPIGYTYCDPLSIGVQRTAKPKRCRISTIYLCKEHMRHIHWKIRRDKVPSKKRLIQDIDRVCQQKMSRRISSRFASAK